MGKEMIVIPVALMLALCFIGFKSESKLIKYICLTQALLIILAINALVFKNISSAMFGF